MDGKVIISKKPRYMDMDITVFDCSCGGEIVTTTEGFHTPTIYYKYCPNCGKEIEWTE